MDDRTSGGNPHALPEDGLRALAYSLARDEAEADDLAQDAWVVVSRRADVPVADRARWNFGVLRNLLRTRRRRERARRRVESAGARTEAEPGAREALERDDIAADVRRSVRALPEPYRRVVEMRWLEELPAEEVARRLGRPAATVRSQSARGLALLRERLDREHGDEHGGGRASWSAAFLAFAEFGSDTRELRTPVPRTRTRWPAPRTRWLVGAAGIAAIVVAARVLEPTPPADTTVALAPTAAAAPIGASTEPLEHESGRRVSIADVQPVDVVVGSAFDASAANSSSSAVVVAVDTRGAPVEGANIFVVRADGARLAGTSDASGRVEFPFGDEDLTSDVRLQAPTKLALVAEDQHAATSLLVHVDRWRATAGAVRIPLDSGGVIVTGRVLDPLGAPLAGAIVHPGEIVARRVELEPGVTRYATSAPRTTDARGQFTLRAAPGRQWLRAWAEGRATTMFALDVGTEREHTVDLRFASGHEIRGHVRLASGEPAAGARVFVEPGGGGLTHEVIASADGSYVLHDVGVGARLVWAVRGAASASLSLDARVGGSATWDPKIGERPALRLRVVDEFGAPRAGWSVSMRVSADARDWQRGMRSDADGRVVVFDVPDSPIEVLVAPLQRYVPYPALHRVLARVESEEVVLVLRAADTASGALRGTLVDASGRRLDLRVGLVARKLGTALVTDVPVDVQSGEFTVEGLPSGEYDVGLAVRSPKYGLEGWIDVGRHAVQVGGVTDLGARVVPAAGSLALDFADEAEGLTFEVLARPSGAFAEHAVTIRTVRGGSAQQFDVFPGEYEVRARDAWRVVGTGRARVDAGRLASIDVTATAR